MLKHSVFSFLGEYIIYYEILFLLNSLYYKISSKFYGTDDENTFSEIKSVAIVYSKKHFNPKNNDYSGIKLQYSASSIAERIYSVFKNNNINIYYYDHSEIIDKLPKVDMVIGIVSENYLRLVKNNPKSKKILFLVNSHPLYRLKALINESKLLNKVFPYSEYVSPLLFLKSIKYTDYFVMIGNDFVRETFIKYRIPKNSITLLNTGINDFLYPDSSKRPKDKIRIAYVGSHLAIRKGLFRVMQVWDKLNSDIVNRDKYELIILGGVDKFKSELERFISKNRNVKYYGWIESNTEQYRELLQSSHIGINLSIEEGQVGCVIDEMSCGLIPIITMESGIGIINGKDGYIVKHDDIECICNIISSLNEQKLRDSIESNLSKYLNMHHNWSDFNKGIEKLLR